MSRDVVTTKLKALVSSRGSTWRSCSFERNCISLQSSITLEFRKIFRHWVCMVRMLFLVSVSSFSYNSKRIATTKCVGLVFVKNQKKRTLNTCLQLGSTNDNTYPSTQRRHNLMLHGRAMGTLSCLTRAILSASFFFLASSA